MEVDYIIVGCGLAGIHFCEQLVAHNKTFVVFNNDSQQSSTVAGGLYNTVVLKRFTPIWKGKEQLDMGLKVYASLEKKLHVKLDYKIPVYRRFNSLEEQNNWFIAADKPLLHEFLSTNLKRNTNLNIKSDLGFGEVKQTGRIDTKTLVKAYIGELERLERIRHTTFKHEGLKHYDQQIIYDDIKSKQIVFAEGYGLIHNPFFNHLPIDGLKGELITIHAPDLKMDYILKSNTFIIPLGNDLYRVGATYDWDDKSNEVTHAAKNELLDKLKKNIRCDFEVLDHVAGIRPTIKDRRPLVGRHHEFPNMYLLNGLGTRGVLIGPYVAEKLFLLVENNQKLEKDISIERFN